MQTQLRDGEVLLLFADARQALQLYLGTTISNNMSYLGTKTGHPPTLSQLTNHATMRRVEALLGLFYTTLHAREYGMRILCQLITEACSASGRV